MSTSELEWLASAAKDCTRIVEIGCWKGRSTKAIATHTPGIVYAVDHWQGSGDEEIEHEVSSKGPDGLHNEFLRNLRPEISAGRVIVVRAASADAVVEVRKLLDGHQADMVFIDADHTYSSVRSDILNYRCLLRDGGLLAGHDYSSAWPGVVQAVDELIPHRSVIRTGSIWHARLKETAPPHSGSGTGPILDLEQMAVRRLERLGDGLRSQGRLDEARDAFDRLLSIDPNHVKAERIVASLTGRAAAGTAEAGGRGLYSAPFVRIPEFLPSPLHDRLLEAVHNSAHRFGPANVVWVDEGGDERREIDHTYRRGEFLSDCFRYFDEDIGRTFRERLAACFPMITSRLQVPLSEFSTTKIHALVSRDGDFFRAHRDTGNNSNRRITFLYYLYEAPKRFTGGDLVLYDSLVHLDSRNDPASGFHPSLYTRLPCTDNELVCFPSEYYHEALAVAGLGDDTRGARVAINGWFLATDAS
jgi:Rps23 Pro-64 3,4-dihydroxylase Tpa1-like proline 4-hydroxylase